MAKTYPMDAVSKTSSKVATPVVKKEEVAKEPVKVAVATEAVDYSAKIEKLEKSIKKLSKNLKNLFQQLRLTMHMIILSLV